MLNILMRIKSFSTVEYGMFVAIHMAICEQNIGTTQWPNLQEYLAKQHSVVMVKCD